MVEGEIGPSPTAPDENPPLSKPDFNTTTPGQNPPSSKPDSDTTSSASSLLFFQTSTCKKSAGQISLPGSCQDERAILQISNVYFSFSQKHYGETIVIESSILCCKVSNRRSQSPLSLLNVIQNISYIQISTRYRFSQPGQSNQRVQIMVATYIS